MNKNLLYRSIPKVDVLLEDSAIQELTGRYGKETVMESVHIETDRLRAYIAKSENEEEARKEISLLVSRVEKTVTDMHTPIFCKVYKNAAAQILYHRDALLSRKGYQLVYPYGIRKPYNAVIARMYLKERFCLLCHSIFIIVIMCLVSCSYLH